MPSHPTEVLSDEFGELGSDQAVTAILAAGAAVAGPTVVSREGESLTAHYVVPTGYELADVDLEALREKYRDHPTRKTGSFTVSTAGSLVAYLGKHATPATELWVDADNHRVRAVIDAHDYAAAGWSDHTATLSLRLSPEWKLWTGASGKLAPQDQFAEFLETNRRDIIDPDAGTILDIVQSIEAATKVDFKSAYRTRDGQRRFRYEETTTARAGQKGELEVPETVGLSIRVFAGSEPLPVRARFRYRLSNAELHLGVVIDRADDIITAAIDTIESEIIDATDDLPFEPTAIYRVS